MISSRRRPAAWMPHLRGAGRAKYVALVNAIREGIATGKLAEGEGLPSQRVLAERLGITVATVTKAIGEASRLGLVVTRPGGGTAVARRSSSTSAESEGGPVDLSINVPPVGVVKPFLDEALTSLARQRLGDQLLGYGPVGGAPRDLEAAATWLALRGVAAPADRTILTQGAHEGLLVTLRVLTRPGDAVVCEGLNYTGLRRLAELCRVRLVPVAVDDRGMRPDALAEACEKERPKAILTTPVTLNPTTATQDAKRRRAIIAAADRASAMIVEDDIYGHLSGDAEPPLVALRPEGVVYLTSLSKCVAPGLRVGYVVGPERYMSRLRDALMGFSWIAPSLAAGLAQEMITSGLATACARAHRAEALARMALAADVLGTAITAGPAATYHAWLRLPPKWNERDAAAALRRHGVVVSPAQHFAMGEFLAPPALRLSLGAASNRATLGRALQTVAGVIASRPSTAAAIV